MADVIPFRPRPRPATPPSGPERNRHRIEGALALALDAVDHLVAALDDMDGDTDLEPDVDGEDGGDGEPSLGAPECHENQVGCFHGGSRDLEQDRGPAA